MLVLSAETGAFTEDGRFSEISDPLAAEPVPVLAPSGHAKWVVSDEDQDSSAVTVVWDGRGTTTAGTS